LAALEQGKDVKSAIDKIKSEVDVKEAVKTLLAFNIIKDPIEYNAPQRVQYIAPFLLLVIIALFLSRITWVSYETWVSSELRFVSINSQNCLSLNIFFGIPIF